MIEKLKEIVKYIVACMTVTFVEAVYQIFLTGLHVRFVKLVYIILSTIAYQTFTFANIRWLILFSRHTPHLPVLVHGHKIEWLPIVDIVLKVGDQVLVQYWKFEDFSQLLSERSVLVWRRILTVDVSGCQFLLLLLYGFLNSLLDLFSVYPKLKYGRISVGIMGRLNFLLNGF